MMQRSSTTAFAKSTRPEIGGVIQRQALYTRLDATPARTIAWIHAPPGFGKTTLAASYLEARNYRWAWYQVDADDDDGESFFHYLTHAVRHLRDGEGALPVFTGQQTDLGAFARRYFRSMFKGRPQPTAIVLDNLHELSSNSPLHCILEAGPGTRLGSSSARPHRSEPSSFHSSRNERRGRVCAHTPHRNRHA